MKPALYRRPVAYWAAPEVDFQVFSPCRPQIRNAAWMMMGRVFIGTHWNDGSITIGFSDQHTTYYIT